jgi:hypothetical protein
VVDMKNTLGGQFYFFQARAKMLIELKSAVNAAYN